jgi:hypothetical protein
VNLDEGWIEVLQPQMKTLACGDFGRGGMCEIVRVIEERFMPYHFEIGRFLKHTLENGTLSSDNLSGRSL